jgi:hypothetical protein
MQITKFDIHSRYHFFGCYEDILEAQFTVQLYLKCFEVRNRIFFLYIKSA